MSRRTHALSLLTSAAVLAAASYAISAVPASAAGGGQHGKPTASASPSASSSPSGAPSPSPSPTATASPTDSRIATTLLAGPQPGAGTTYWLCGNNVDGQGPYCFYQLATGYHAECAAVLLDAAGQPVVGRTITFGPATFSGWQAQCPPAVTDANGVAATAGVPATWTCGTYSSCGVSVMGTAEFAGDGTYAPSRSV